MSTHFTPKWKDKKGNVVIFPARNTLFEDYKNASDWQVGQFIFMVPFGFSPAGILEFEAKNGHADIPHIKGTAGVLGTCCLIDGPDGPDHTASLRTAQPQSQSDQGGE